MVEEESDDFGLNGDDKRASDDEEDDDDADAAALVVFICSIAYCRFAFFSWVASKLLISSKKSSLSSLVSDAPIVDGELVPMCERVNFDGRDRGEAEEAASVRVFLIRRRRR